MVLCMLYSVYVYVMSVVDIMHGYCYDGHMYIHGYIHGYIYVCMCVWKEGTTYSPLRNLGIDVTTLHKKTEWTRKTTNTNILARKREINSISISASFSFSNTSTPP